MRKLFGIVGLVGVLVACFYYGGRMAGREEQERRERLEHAYQKGLKTGTDKLDAELDLPGKDLAAARGRLEAAQRSNDAQGMVSALNELNNVVKRDPAVSNRCLSSGEPPVQDTNSFNTALDRAERSLSGSTNFSPAEKQDLIETIGKHRNNADSNSATKQAAAEAAER